jgi:hypothetical protein
VGLLGALFRKATWCTLGAQDSANGVIQDLGVLVLQRLNGASDSLIHIASAFIKAMILMAISLA